MEFTDYLINRLHTFKFNPIIGFLLISLIMTFFIAMNSDNLSPSEAWALIFTGPIIIIVTFFVLIGSLINTPRLDKLENFLILNRTKINQNEKSHKEILSLFSLHWWILFPKKTIESIEEILTKYEK